jgi:REP element-mobilizing transposase RayT
VDPPRLPARKRLRWLAHDYAAYGAYFITICVRWRRCVLGRVVDGRVIPSGGGIAVRAAWNALAQRHACVHLDAFVAMPNHIHGIVALHDAGRRRDRADCTLSDVIGGFKSMSSLAYAAGVREHGWRSMPTGLWQRGFYDRVIRDERELAVVRGYIRLNPERWTRDRLNPDRVR